MWSRYAAYQWEETQDHNTISSILLTPPVILCSSLRSFCLQPRKERGLSLLQLTFNSHSRWVIPSSRSFSINLHCYRNVIKIYIFHLRTTISLNTIDCAAIHLQKNNKKYLRISKTSSDLMKSAQRGARPSPRVQWSSNQDQTIQVMWEIIKAALEISIHTIKK